MQRETVISRTKVSESLGIDEEFGVGQEPALERIGNHKTFVRPGSDASRITSHLPLDCFDFALHLL